MGRKLIIWMRTQAHIVIALRKGRRVGTFQVFQLHCSLEMETRRISIPCNSSPEEIGGNLIKITSSATGEDIEIKHQCCEEAHRTLGVMKIPRGDSQAELQVYLQLLAETPHTLGRARCSPMRTVRRFQS